MSWKETHQTYTWSTLSFLQEITFTNTINIKNMAVLEFIMRRIMWSFLVSSSPKLLLTSPLSKNTTLHDRAMPMLISQWPAVEQLASTHLSFAGDVRMSFSPLPSCWFPWSVLGCSCFWTVLPAQIYVKVAMDSKEWLTDRQQNFRNTFLLGPG